MAIQVEAVELSETSVAVSWRLDRHGRSRVTLMRGQTIEQGPIIVLSYQALEITPGQRFRGLQPATTYKVLVETDDDRGELIVTTSERVR